MKDTPVDDNVNPDPSAADLSDPKPRPAEGEDASTDTDAVGESPGE